MESLQTKLNYSKKSAIVRNSALLVTAQMDLCKQLLSTLDTEDKDLIIADQGRQAQGGGQRSGHQ